MKAVIVVPPIVSESEVESFLEGSHGDRTHLSSTGPITTVTPLCGTLLQFREASQRTDPPQRIGFISFPIWKGFRELLRKVVARTTPHFRPVWKGAFDVATTGTAPQVSFPFLFGEGFREGIGWQLYLDGSYDFPSICGRGFRRGFEQRVTAPRAVLLCGRASVRPRAALCRCAAFPFLFGRKP